MFQLLIYFLSKEHIICMFVLFVCLGWCSSACVKGFSSLTKLTVTKTRCDDMFSLCTILLSFCYFHSFLIPSALVIEIEKTLYLRLEIAFLSFWKFSIQMCVIITMPTRVMICMNCLESHKAFWHLPVGSSHPSLDSVSVLVFTTLPVCLSYGTKQMLYSVHIRTLWNVRTTYASAYTQISILSG